MPVAIRAFLGLVLLAVAALGCSAIASPDLEELGPEPQICTPGVCAKCPCTDGRMGWQRCKDDSTFDTCMDCGKPMCTAAGAAGSGP